MDRLDLEILELISDGRKSGEYIAQKLNISRVAVWKRIKKLQQLGYEIDVNKKGYRLLNDTESLLPVNIKKLLKTKYIGREYIYLDEVVSTNLYLKENRELPNGTVVLAERQTGGRGRKGRKWVSPKYKGLYFSVLLKKDIELKTLSLFSLIFPLTVREIIQKYTRKKVYIKWPNDIYIGNRKLSGTLIETEIEGNSINNLIAGIGININSDREDLKDVLDIATSLYIEEEKKFDRGKILAEILNLLEEKIENFSPKETVIEVNKYLLWKNRSVKILDTDIKGILVGVNMEGALVLRTPEGLKTVYNGDLSLRQID